MLAVSAPVSHRVLVRALTWALIGAIYAPLFIMLNTLFAEPLGAGSLVAAAGIAGASGAAFYGARQVALAAALVGVSAAWLVLLLPDHEGLFWVVALLSVGAGLALGLLVQFPARCTRRVPTKVLSGGLTGALCGAVLVALTLGAGLALSVPVLVAFLVSVNGVLYVALLPRLAAGRPPLGGRWCDLMEGLVIALVAVVVGASVWGFVGTWSDQPAVDPLTRALTDSMWHLPSGVITGLVTGGVTGALLELFDFSWTEQV